MKSKLNIFVKKTAIPILKRLDKTKLSVEEIEEAVNGWAHNKTKESTNIHKIFTKIIELLKIRDEQKRR